MRRTTTLITIAAPLLLGAAIYLLFRPTSLVLFQWVDLLGLTEPVASARALAEPVRLPRILIDSAPAGLWAWSFAAAFRAIWRDEPLPRLTCTLAVLALGAGSELLQLPGLVPGTFDPTDLAFYLTGTGFGAVSLPRKETT